MTFHPNDKIIERIQKAKILHENDLRETEEANKLLEEIHELLKETTMPSSYIDLFNMLVKALAQIGENRLDINRSHVELLYLIEMQNEKIEYILERLAGLGEYK
jgi:DNA repair ATPase RecN